jgi:acyl carrier protein
LATVYDRLKKVIVDRLDVEETKIVPQSRFSEDLEADSLDLVELIMAIEEEFTSSNSKLEIPDEEAESIKTVQHVLDYLASQGVKGS